ncbi:MAG: toll/interleukin-1 receptor domain-containing protein, partial [Alphaproteobacteria bacterium]|nr:toll/interleukin-1 receptor domain-containing protein [Alphaproteobacteria bacterium]
MSSENWRDFVDWTPETMATPVAAPICFISYARETDEHHKWVEGLASDLDSKGVDVRFDEWDVGPGDSVIQFMEKSLREANFVLMICTPLFAEKANEGIGGVGYEKGIVASGILLKLSKNKKFIPVLRAGSIEQSVPYYLQERLVVDFREDAKRAESFAILLRCIQGISRRPRPRPPRDSDDPQPTTATPPAQPRPPAPPKPIVFDMAPLQTIVSFAKSRLGMEQQKALSWADGVLAQSPPFDFVRFKQLFEFAFNVDDLDLAKPDAFTWASKHLNDNPPIDVARVKIIRRFAMGRLQMDRQKALDWAEEKVARTPPFDF